MPNKNEGGGKIFQKLIRRTPSFIRHTRVEKKPKLHLEPDHEHRQEVHFGPLRGQKSKLSVQPQQHSNF